MTERTHTIVLPFWCDNEVDRFARIAACWPELTQSDVKHDFLLIARVDYTARPVALIQTLERHAPVEYIRCEGPLVYRNAGHYHFPRTSPMWVHAIERMRARYSTDDEFFLWFEADMMFTDPHWLDRLDAEWLEHKPLALGPKVETPHARPHLNGGSCYVKNISDYAAVQRFRISKRPFDIELSLRLQFAGLYDVRVRHSEAWEFRLTEFYRRERYEDTFPGPEKAILHGCKTDDSFATHLAAARQLATLGVEEKGLVPEQPSA